MQTIVSYSLICVDAYPMFDANYFKLFINLLYESNVITLLRFTLTYPMFSYDRITKLLYSDPNAEK